jgi:ribosomal protein L7/L12
MANGDKSINVSRREFYGALVIVWLYIMLVLGDLMRIEERWSTGLLCAASLFMVIAYSVVGIRAMPSRGTAAKAAMSDCVKQLASDPSQKIEAIKVYREETGASLAEAKEAVEAFINSK